MNIRNISTPGRVGFITLFALCFWSVLVATVPMNIIKQVFDSLAFGASMVLFVTWTRDAIRAVHYNDAEPAEIQFLIALAITEGVLSAQRLYAIVFYQMERPHWLSDSFLGSIWGYLFFVCGVLFMMAPGTANPSQRGRSLVMTGVAIAIGCLTAGILIGWTLRPPSVVVLPLGYR